MRIRSLFLKARVFLIKVRMKYLKWLGMDIASSARISLSAKIDITFPKGVHIGKWTYVGGSLLLSHDFVRKMHCNTYIGDCCFIGMNSIILPGVAIGDCSIVGAGSVVTKDVPSHCIVVGNPAVIIKDNIEVGKFGQILKKKIDGYIFSNRTKWNKSFSVLLSKRSIKIC